MTEDSESYTIRRVSSTTSDSQVIPNDVYNELLDFMADRYRPLEPGEFTVNMLVADVRRVKNVSIDYNQVRQILFEMEKDGALTSTKRAVNSRSANVYKIVDVDKFHTWLERMLSENTE